MVKKVVRTITPLAILAFWVVCSWAEQGDDEATKLFDLANGLYIRGKAFYGQATIQYREFLKRYASDERCDQATLFLGNCLRELGKNEEALQAYLDHQRFKSSPNRDMVDFRTGQVYFSLGKYPDAIRYLEKVYNKKVEQDLASSSAFWLGWAYLKNERPREAIPVLAKLADGEKNPLAPWANFHLGYAYLAAEDFEKAIERLQKAAADLPERRDESLFRVAEAYAKLDKYQNAYTAYKELVEKHPKSPFRGRAAFGAVWSLYTAKDYGAAIAVYQVCEKLVPQESQAEAAYIVANCNYETNNVGEALRQYERVAKDFPTSPFAARAEYKACWCLFAQGKFDEAIASGTAFVKKHSGYAEIDNVHFLLAESLYERNRVDEALNEYQIVVVKHPKNVFREKAVFKLGMCYLKTGQLEKARETFRDFASAYPASDLAAKALARSAECGLALARDKKAKADFQRSQYEEVAHDYRELVEKYPKDDLAGEALYQLGVTYVRLEKHDEMIRAFQKLVKDYPKSENCAGAYYWLASESEKDENDDLAADYLERSLRLQAKGPYSDEAKYRLAGIYSKKGEKEKAVALIVEMLRENLQTDISAKDHLAAGDFLLEKGRYDGAIEVYNLFLRKFKDKGSPLLEGAYYGLGDCYFKQGKWQQAIENFNQAMEFKGDLVSLSRLYSGMAQLKLGRNRQAEELFNEVAQSGVIELEAKAYYWLGNMRFDLGQAMRGDAAKAEQYKKALGDSLAEYMRVVIIYPKSEVRPECMFRVAECLELQGSTEEAMKQLGELIREYPDHELAKKAREKLGNVPASATGG